MQTLLDLTFHSCPTRLKDVRRAVAEVAEGSGCSDSQVHKLKLVIDEAVSNIIRHGYGGQKDGEIRLRVTRQQDRLAFHLRDNAPPVDPACIKPRDLSECRPGGLGINFIDSVMDEWSFSCPTDGSGNVLEMTKTIEREPS
ncbi:MAG: ATP-binding protein [Pseudomonadota bacterium]